jgi:hypothetical protein
MSKPIAIQRVTSGEAEKSERSPFNCPFCGERLRPHTMARFNPQITFLCPKEYLIGHPPMIWLPFLENPTNGHRDVEPERDPGNNQDFPND